MPATPARPFETLRWELPLSAQGLAGPAHLALEPFDDAAAAALATQIARIDPWQRMGYGATAMRTYLASTEAGACRRIIRLEGEPVGAVCVRHPWLRGPYLELLAILPGHQARGLGAAVLGWMEHEVAGLAANLWVCTSTFNLRGLAFYERHGFGRIADLQDLVGPGFTEILLRKRI